MELDEVAIEFLNIVYGSEDESDPGGLDTWEDWRDYQADLAECRAWEMED